jgi:predicted Zn-dependent peptidase
MKRPSPRHVLLALALAGVGCHGSAPAHDVAVVPPPTSSAPAVPPIVDESFRKTAPAPDGEVVFHPPHIEETRLSNGLRVLVVTRRELPIVTVQLAVRRGADQAPPGLAAFAAALLTQGTKTTSSLQFSDAIRDLGGSLSSWAAYDATYVSGRCLSGRLGAFLDLMGAAAMAPAFDKQEIERERASRLTSIAQQDDRPQTVLWNTTIAALYPAGHPYASLVLGDAAAVKRATKADLERVYAATMGPSDAVLSFAGDISLEQAKAEAERVFGAWKGAQKPRATTADAPPAAGKPSDPSVVLVERPGATQSQVSVALVGVPRKNPDFEAVLVMNTIFGGPFSSRLNMNLREKHAYTYGARSGFDMRLGPGPFTAGGAIETRATAPAIQEIFAELGRITSEPVTDEELATAKKYLIGQLPARFESTGETASTVASLALYDLPLDEFEKRAARVQAVTAADVQRVARKYLGDGKRLFVVGDASLEPELAKLGLGKVVVRKAKAKPKSTTPPAGPPARKAK